MTAQLVFIVPNVDLINSNDRTHYQATAKKRSLLRELVGKAAVGLPAVAAPARGVVTFVWADRRRRDADNVELKWLWDGLVDAGVLVDDRGEVLRATVRFAAPWRHGLGQGLTVLGVKVQSIGPEGGEA